VLCLHWQVDAIDYDARLEAYGCLRPDLWRQMRSVEALPLLHQCLADVRNADDLALRNAAAQALGRFIDAAAHLAAAQQEAAARGSDTAALAIVGAVAVPCALPSGHVIGASGDDPSKGSILPLVQRVLYRQLKRTLSSSDLAVRQVRVLPTAALLKFVCS
jgi:U3 small nucleolar RNA-associated protein 20